MHGARLQIRCLNGVMSEKRGGRRINHAKYQAGCIHREFRRASSDRRHVLCFLVRGC